MCRDVTSIRLSLPELARGTYSLFKNGSPSMRYNTTANWKHHHRCVACTLLCATLHDDVTCNNRSHLKAARCGPSRHNHILKSDACHTLAAPYRGFVPHQTRLHSHPANQLCSIPPLPPPPHTHRVQKYHRIYGSSLAALVYSLRCCSPAMLCLNTRDIRGPTSSLATFTQCW